MLKKLGEKSVIFEVGAPSIIIIVIDYEQFFSLHSICQQRYVSRFILIFQIKLWLKIRYLDHKFCKSFSKRETYGRKLILIILVEVVFQELAFFKSTDTYLQERQFFNFFQKMYFPIFYWRRKIILKFNFIDFRLQLLSSENSL